MTHIEKIVLVPYKAKSMYNLVNDIESYPDFLPWCGGARVVQRGAKEMVAEIDIKFKAPFIKNLLDMKTTPKKIAKTKSGFRAIRANNFIFHFLFKCIY